MEVFQHRFIVEGRYWGSVPNGEKLPIFWRIVFDPAETSVGSKCPQLSVQVERKQKTVKPFVAFLERNGRI
jgi:hypothetical protein